MLYDEANHAKVPVSLATVYNTLHQFTEVGLLRQVAVDGSKAYFDTNNSEHHHFFIEDQDDLMDIPSSDVVVGKAPVPPEVTRSPASTSWYGFGAKGSNSALKFPFILQSRHSVVAAAGSPAMVVGVCCAATHRASGGLSTPMLQR